MKRHKEHLCRHDRARLDKIPVSCVESLAEEHGFILINDKKEYHRVFRARPSNYDWEDETDGLFLLLPRQEWYDSGNMEAKIMYDMNFEYLCYWMRKDIDEMLDSAESKIKPSSRKQALVAE